jgi:hypothetical protein
MARAWYFLFLFIGDLNSGSEGVGKFIKSRGNFVTVRTRVFVSAHHEQGASGQHFLPAFPKAKPLAISGRHIEIAFQIVSVARG